MTNNLKRLDSLYQELGPEKIISLVEKFYFFMDNKNECKGIRGMHGVSLESAREKLTAFLTQRFGGPWLYNNKYGPPMMRGRHMPFKIAVAQRNQWLYAMDLALKEMEFDQELEDLLFVFFTDFSEKIRNH